MKKVFHLKTCSTCIRIIKSIDWPSDIEFQNIKEENLSKDQLRRIAKITGSYESLFSRRAMKYKSMGLAQKTLGEKEYEKFILEEYTFLKRPVVIYGDQVFVGNSKKVSEAMIDYFKAL